jgi:carbonic anhydrase/acetyltransferase-like protein (isoleucine patch superfamily)
MLRSFGKSVPRAHKSAFVHDSAEVIGKVELAAKSSVWPLCSLRGDIDRIVVGEGTNIQDLTVIHTREGFPTVLGKAVTVGHNVILHGCRIGDGTLVGMGAIVMEAVVGKDCLIAAGALLLAGFRAPDRSVIMGSPAKVVRRITPKELAHVRRGQKQYVKKAVLHRTQSRPLFSA